MLALSASPIGDVAVADAETGSSQDVCVDVQIGGDRSAYYDCLNRQLRNGVPPHGSATANVPPVGAATPAYQVGGYNQAAVREQLGSAFGHSVTPQRPAPPPPPFPLSHR